VNDAFLKFRSRLELTQKEQDDASRRQQEIRKVMDNGFRIQDDFLTGSYRRWTKTKPLKDVDIFEVLHDDERAKHRDGKPPASVLDAVKKCLVKKYGEDAVTVQRRSVMVELGGADDDEHVMSFDVVPAFTKSDHYEIPDTDTSKGWTETDPRVHADKATEANKAFAGEWKGMVRMAKAWNREQEKVVSPSFLLEVMALQILRPPFGGSYSYEFLTFFQTAADRIGEEWSDPAGLGPPVSDSMTLPEKEAARRALQAAHDKVREAINHERAGRLGEALNTYRQLFGKRFPLS